MKFIGDFHIHSHYSIATSKNLNPEHLEIWAKIKGIQVIGTGDFTHPGWLAELKEKLEPAEQGLFKLKEEYRESTAFVPELQHHNMVRFILTAEISNIYKKAERVRKVHNVLFAPDFNTAEDIQKALSRIGNIRSDGRPILGLDSRDLLELALDASENIFFVPAHIWTPWFSVLGDKSGFGTIEECYSDLADHIFAVETGLSSDAPMNWICSFLDRYTLISDSDAHSPEKLGRNANLFNTEISYDAIIEAMKSGNPEKFLGTIDLFPQEGKYHYDGHRKCNICWNPVETLKNDGICSVCGRKVTVGVMHRVAELSDRNDVKERPNRMPFYSIIPLKEILSEILGVGANSKQVAREYFAIIQKVGTELDILLNVPEDEIRTAGGEVLSEAVHRMRSREVVIKEGFDGEFGRVNVFQKGELKTRGRQAVLFKTPVEELKTGKQHREMIDFDLEVYRNLCESKVDQKILESPHFKEHLRGKEEGSLKDLDPDQRKAVRHFKGPALVIAGPGTGKTSVLTSRVAFLVHECGVDPGNILAVTFTNKASMEMKERLKTILKGGSDFSELQVSTFHAFGASLLRQNAEVFHRTRDFMIIDQHDKEFLLLKELGIEKSGLKRRALSIHDSKHKLKKPEDIKDPELSDLMARYEEVMQKQNLFDLDDLITRCNELFSEHPAVMSMIRKQIEWILVDEYQDVDYAQYRMIRSLMPDTDSNVYVIGDPNQAIYGFRGADVQFIRSFREEYPKAAVYRLSKSYRCTNRILRASDDLIFSGVKDPVLVSDKSMVVREPVLHGLQEGVKIHISEHSSDKSEAEFVARTIEQMMGGLRFFSIDSEISEGQEQSEISSLSDFAVLCRISRQMKVVEKAFQDHTIPYQMVSDEGFFRQEPLRSVKNMLKLAFCPESSVLKKQVIDGKIIRQQDMADLLERVKKARLVKDGLAKIMESISNSLKTGDLELLEKLQSMACGFGDDYRAFFTFVALGSGVDTFQKKVENVTLMTLHAAKGLEFECVFIVGCENGLLPYSVLENHQSDIEEERRLLYVGMTRAKHFLYLTHARKRFLMGREMHLERSPFLNRIQEELIDLAKGEYRKPARKGKNQLDLF